MKMRKKIKSTLSQQLELKSELKCDHCGKEFRYESERKRHEQSHSPQFACKACNKKFSFMSALRRHEKQHERTGSVCCPHCNRKFRDDSLLKRHIKYAHKGTYTCIKCNGIFNSDLALHSHMKIHKPESERKYRCSFEGCTKTFNFPHHLKHHELTHTNTKQYFCSTCDKGFIQYHHMKSHLKTHELNSSLLCPFPNCYKSFAHDAALKKHVRRHRNTGNTDTTSAMKKDEITCKETGNIDTTSAMNKDEITCKETDISEDASAESKPLADTDFNESEFVLNEPSSQLNWREQFLEHDNQCNIKDNIRASNNLCQSEDEELLMLQKVDSLEIKEDIPISNCKSSLGECIMGEDVNGERKCLCAQIQSIEDTYEFSANKNKYCNPDTKVDIKDSNLKPVKIINSCDNCDCMGDSLLETVNVIKDNNNMDSLNQINDIVDYKSDGTVKIKEELLSSISEIPAYSIERIINGRNVSDNVPFNSCKAVLGRCIVSGNGNIDESCLCAKMAMDDQQMLDQEITELTPCPKE